MQANNTISSLKTPLSQESLKEILLGEEIKKKFPHFELRKTQLEMVKVILKAINESKISLIEASTGTGKSLAYLIPFLLFAYKNNTKVVISTFTKSLQHQLIEKDLPIALDILGLPIQYALVKGKKNYLCLKRFHEMISFNNSYEQLIEDQLQTKVKNEISIIEKWLTQTKTGDLEELNRKEIEQIYPDIFTENDLCTHNRCPHFQDCFIYKMKELHNKSHILVTNHSLLVAQMELTYYDIENSLLPAFEYLVIDEAHNFEKSALIEETSSYWGFIQNLHHIFNTNNRGKRGVLNQLVSILKRNKDISKIEEKLIGLIENDLKESVNQVKQNAEFFFLGLFSHLEDLNLKEKTFRIYEENILEFQSFQDSYEELCLSLNYFLELLENTENHMNLLNEEFQKEHQMKWKALNQFKRFSENKFHLWDKLFDPPSEKQTLWFEINTKIQNVSLHYVNLDNKDFLNSTLYDTKKTIVMTSATLSINGNLEYLKKQLKIERETIQTVLPTPFHYKEQCRMMVVKNLAEPSGGDSTNSLYFKESLNFIKQIIETSGGGVLILCTSFTQLNYLEQNLKDFNEQYPLFIQNTKTTSVLLKEFQESGKGILIGVDSFWEGIDVIGKALKTVVIMKLPFKPPTNPISQTLYEIAQKEGKNAFTTVSVPEAVIRFKQGFGRLIRSRKDKGCVICLDSRIITKAYGREFISSLPTRTYHLEKEEILKTIKEFS